MEKFPENGSGAGETPVCSVCIANYNGIDFIQACIDSVLAQDAEFSYEIIVHDDASTDDSVAFIRNHYPNVRLIASDDNVGFCVSNNRMAATARGQYILLLNNDAALFSDALRTLHGYATSLLEPAILGLPQYDAETNALLDIGSHTDLFLNSIPNKAWNHMDVAMVAGACLWIPTDLWRKIGGFPPWFHTLAEDLYICCVARLWGYSVQAIPRSGFRHWVGKSIGGGRVTIDQRLSTSRRRRALTERNKTFVMFMTYPRLWLSITLLLHFLLLHLEGMILAVVKRDRRIWSEIYAPVFPALWRARKLLVSNRHSIFSHRCANSKKFITEFQLIPHKLTMLFRHGLPHIQ